MDYQFKNLVFEGGGVKGISYIGALEELDKRGILKNISRIGGTSAGAINAVILGLGYTKEETQKTLWELDFNKFMDDTFGMISDTARLMKDYGWHKGDFFRDWIAGLIKQKTGNSEATFADIEVMKESKGFKSIYLIGTNLSTACSETFSAEHTPRMCVADAARISMSIPLFFTAKRSLRGDIYVDGGVLDNYPVKLFDRKKYLETRNYKETDYYKKINKNASDTIRPISEYVYNQETLGFRLDTRDEISVFRDHAEHRRNSIESLFDFTRALINTLLEAQQSHHLHSDDWARTIYIDTLGVQTTDFNLSDETKKKLIKSGKEGALNYFSWFDNEVKKRAS